ncbi:MAG: branched-chain amino acid ABC transporter permease [Alphaproteobacteria bacterium]|jgi:branched-chain amino acid transport system permease protein|nr:branched-chain amino acid ABC transporter permease [Alphaproteobacteria bacterium]
MSRFLDKTIWGLTIGLVILLVLNFAVEEWMRFIGLQSFARGLVALGLLILWRTGLISFGHALFFGIGAYAAALLQRTTGVTDAFLLVIVGTLASGLLAFLLGFLLRRYRAIFFALLNLAFSMILYGVLAKLEVLGSTDGIGVAQPTFAGFAPEGETNHIVLFVVAALFTYLVAVGAHVYLGSTLGAMTKAVRENEIRVEYLGYSAEQVIHVKYVISGLLAGLGGALMGMTVGHVDPDSMVYWPISGDFVFITILSGTGNVAATFIGALVFELIRTFAFEHAPQIWQLIMGGALLAIIMFLPDGLWSLVDKYRASRTRAAASRQAAE